MGKKDMPLTKTVYECSYCKLHHAAKSHWNVKEEAEKHVAKYHPDGSSAEDPLRRAEVNEAVIQDCPYGEHTGETQFDKAVARDQFGNVAGAEFDLCPDDAFEGQKVLIIKLCVPVRVVPAFGSGLRVPRVCAFAFRRHCLAFFCSCSDDEGDPVSNGCAVLACACRWQATHLTCWASGLQSCPCASFVTLPPLPTPNTALARYPHPLSRLCSRPATKSQAAFHSSRQRRPCRRRATRSSCCRRCLLRRRR